MFNGAVFFCRDQGICVSDCRGASISFDVGGRSSLRGAAAPFCLFGCFAPVAFHIHLEDGCVMHEPVDGGQRHGWVGKYRVPFSERLISRDQHGAAFVSRTDELEEHTGLGLILSHIGDVIEDQQVELVEFRDRAFELEVTARLLKFLDQIGGAAEEDAIALLDKRQPDGRPEMRLAHAWRAEQQDVAALSDPAVTSSDGDLPPNNGYQLACILSCSAFARSREV